MTDSILCFLRGLSREDVEALVANMSHDLIEALNEELPRADLSVDPAKGGPADFAEALDPGYRRRRHVDLLSAAIEETVVEAQDGSGPGRLIVNMPPRVGKSWTTSLWAPAWHVERWPDRRVVLVSHEGNYAISWGRRVRDLLRRQADAGRVQVRVARDPAAAGEWETTLGGGMLSRGIGGSITGRGAHLLIIDDPLKDFAAAHSQGVRDGQWQWMLSTALARLDPGAAVVVVMTRWHEDDLAGRLLSAEHEGDPDEWRVLRIPALGEGAVDDADDALDREPDVPLLLASTDETGEQASERWRRIRRSVGPYIWAGMYQQRPSEPEGTILKRAWWQFYRRLGDRLVLPGGDPVPLEALRIVQSWDLAFKDKTTSDYVVGQVWGLAAADRYLLDQIRDRMDYPAAKRAMRDLRGKWPTTGMTVVEDKANGPAIIAELRRELSGLVPWNPPGDKVLRAYSVQGELEAGNVWLPEPGTAGFDVRGLIDECAQFPNGTHDDQVDAFTQVVLKTRAGRGEVGKPQEQGQQGQATLPTTQARITRK